MIAKTVEIRDRATFIPALAIRLDPETEADCYLLARAGYGFTPRTQRAYVLLARIAGGEGAVVCNPRDWAGGITMATAHEWLIDHFDEIESGAVVDVEYIMGVTKTPKVSERLAS